MSFDREIDQVCNHFVLQELLYLSADRQTIVPVRGIASVASVNVRLNGLTLVPSYGVLTSAQSQGSLQGPFNIRGTNNLLALSINGGEVQSVSLPSSSNMTVTTMANLLNAGFSGVTFSSANNYLQFSSNESGPGARIFIQGSSTLGTPTGLVVNREYRGKTAYPGWTLIGNSSTTFSGYPTRNIVFDTPLRGFNDVVEIDYVTTRQDCRRCGGLGVENDWRYGYDGNTGEVRDEALLIQENLKICFTVEGSNPFHTWYGSKVLEQIGQKIDNHGFVQNLLVQSVSEAITRWQSIKKSQEEVVGQVVTDREYPYRLVSVDIEQSTQDQTVIYMTVTIQNRSGNPVDITRGLKLPQPTDLLGSTVAQGVFRQSLANYAAIG